MNDIQRCGRGHVLSGWGDVDTYCNRCHEELFVLERELGEARQQLAAAVGALRVIERALDEAREGYRMGGPPPWLDDVLEVARRSLGGSSTA